MWSKVHNIVAHPLMGIFNNAAWTEQFHNWTAERAWPDTHTHTHNGVTYDVYELWKLVEDEPVIEIEIAQFMKDWSWEADLSLEIFVGQMKRVMSADLSYPIIIHPEGHVMDGMHRIAKAALEGRTHISAKRYQG